MTTQSTNYEFKTFEDFLAAPVDWDLRGNPIPRSATLHGPWEAAARYGFESARKLKQDDNQVLGHRTAPSGLLPFIVAERYHQAPEPYSSYKDKEPTSNSPA